MGSLEHRVIGDEGELVMIGQFFEDQDFASVIEVEGNFDGVLVLWTVQEVHSVVKDH